MNLAKRILEGDIRAASRLMRDIDDRIPSAMNVLKELYPRTGRGLYHWHYGTSGLG